MPEADPSKLAVQSAPGSSPTASLSVLLRSKVEEVELEFALGADGHVYLLRCLCVHTRIGPLVSCCILVNTVCFVSVCRSLRFGRVSPVSVSHIASLSATFSPAPSLLPVVPEASRPAGKPDYKKGSYFVIECFAMITLLM